MHFGDYWQGRAGDQLSSSRALGAPREPPVTARARDQHRALLLEELQDYADPIPDAEEIIAGIPSKNAKRLGANEAVATAIASRKVHYMFLLTQHMGERSEHE
eukprot:5230603-Pyramimonas_sp.AAC.1